MPHPLQSQMLDRMSRSTGHAVGWRPLAQRAVLSLMLGLSMVSAVQPAFAHGPVNPAPREQVVQASQTARWWGQGGIGFSAERFKTDMQARGFTPSQAISAYQWMDHLSAPTFGHASAPAHGQDWTTQGFHDRAEYSASLVQALEQGPAQFDAWQKSTINDFRQMLDGVSAQDQARILQIHEYSDALGVMPQVMEQLAAHDAWGNEKWSWSGFDHVVANDRQWRAFEASGDASLTLAQARAHLEKSVHDTGLRFFRAPVSMMQSPQDIQGLADMLHGVNAQVQQQTGLTGPALGLNGRVSWDMTLPPGDNEGVTNEHAGGIAIRGTQSIIFHEFAHALGAAMSHDVGITSIDGTMGQLFQSLEAMHLPYSPQINAERWQALAHMGEEMGITPTQSQWLSQHTEQMSREDIRATLLSQGVSPLNASYLAANVDVLHAQAKDHQTLAFVEYRNTVLTLVAADKVGLPTDYLLDMEETVAYQAQYRMPGSHPIDTWQTPTASEMKLQDGLWEAYYAKARAWQQADLHASQVAIQPEKASFLDRIATRRAPIAQVELAPSLPRPGR